LVSEEIFFPSSFYNIQIRKTYAPPWCRPILTPGLLFRDVIWSLNGHPDNRIRHPDTSGCLDHWYILSWLIFRDLFQSVVFRFTSFLIECYVPKKFCYWFYFILYSIWLLSINLVCMVLQMKWKWNSSLIVSIP
jgi:hypothetical protein